MQTMISATRTPEIREAIQIFRGVPDFAQRDLIAFLRGVAFGIRASASPAPQAAPDPRVRIGGWEMEVTLKGTPEEIRKVFLPPSMWIPVDEKLPEEGQLVIVCRRTRGRQLVSGVGRYAGENRWTVFGSNARLVDRWQPIPPPPEEPGE